MLVACKTAPTSAPADAAPALIDAARPAPTVDLLLETDAKITVSSRVDNPRDYPEHLVDGRPDTAWNGKTGDLNGWIEVKLADDVHVQAIAMTCGFDKKKGAEDLFFENHRIKSLRVLRDGAPLREVTFDVARRELQSIPIDAPGGTYRLEVLETVPGTKKEWRELTVSDLKFYGTPGAARLPAPRLPHVDVAPGSAPAPKPIVSVGEIVAEGRTAPSLAALCDAWTKDVERAVQRDMPGAGNFGPYCRPLNPPPKVEGTPPWKSVRAVALDRFYGNFVSTEDHLVLELDDGTLVIGPYYDHHDDLGCASEPVTLATGVRATSAQLTIARAILHPHVDVAPSGLMTTSGGDVEDEALVCPITSGRPKCPSDYTKLGTTSMTEADLTAFQSTPRLRWP
jgi:hypothetical protein